MKKQHRIRPVVGTLAVAFSSLTTLQAGEGFYEAASGYQNYFPSGEGTPTYASPYSNLPLTTYSYFNRPWNLPSENGVEFLAGLNFGYSGNINYEIYNPHDSSFYQVNAGLRGLWSNGRTRFGYELGVTGTRYDDGIDRDEHDKSMYDFVAHTRLRHEVGSSSVFYNDTYLHQGAHASLRNNIIWPGVQQKDFFNWRSTSQLAWRTDGQPEFSTGWQQRSSVYYGGFRQDGDDWYDSYRVSVSHEAQYITSPGKGWFGVGEYGMRDFKQMGDYNSDSLRLGGGHFGTLPCGAHYRLEAGLQQLDYDNSHYPKRDELYVNSSIYGTLARVDYRLFLNYGIHQDFVNWGGGNFVDPIGTKAGLTLSVQASDKLRLGFNFSGQSLEADSTPAANARLGFYSAGINAIYKLDENSELNLDLGIHRVSFDNGGVGKSDTFGTILGGYTLKF